MDKAIVADEDNKPKGRCAECNERVSNFYMGTLLCMACYKKQKRRKPVVMTLCFGCKKKIKSGYKGT